MKRQNDIAAFMDIQMHRIKCATCPPNQTHMLQNPYAQVGYQDGYQRLFFCSDLAFLAVFENWTDNFMLYRHCKSQSRSLLKKTILTSELSTQSLRLRLLQRGQRTADGEKPPHALRAGWCATPCFSSLFEKGT